MMNNNHKNSGCGFSEELVSYLYGETDAAENTAFEAHLKSCSVCADELEAFSGVHFSINDWKLKEFANLETPVIEIPYEKAEKAPDKQEVSTVTGSWVSGLRNLISLSPAWPLGAASFAVLMIVVVVAWFALNSGNSGSDKTVAESNTKEKTKPVFKPTAEKTPEPSNVPGSKTNPQDKDIKPNDNQKRPQPEVADTTGTNPKSKQAVKVVNTPRTVQKVDNPNTPKTADANRKKNNDPKLGPKVAPEDEDEDKSLRLAEIFDEIDTK